jgi:hypothetical protein
MKRGVPYGSLLDKEQETVLLRQAREGTSHDAAGVPSLGDLERGYIRDKGGSSFLRDGA